MNKRISVVLSPISSLKITLLEQIEEVEKGVALIKSGAFSKYVVELERLSSIIETHAPALQKSPEILSRIADAIGIEAKGRGVEVLIDVQDGLKVQIELIKLMAICAPTDRAPLDHLRVLVELENEAYEGGTAIQYGHCEQLAQKTIGESKTWADKLKTTQAIIMAERHAALGIALQHLTKGIITATQDQAAVFSFIPCQEDFVGPHAVCIKAIGHALGGNKDASEIELYWYSAGRLLGLSPTVKFWETVVSKGPEDTALDEVISQIRGPVQDALKSYVAHIRRKNNEAIENHRVEDWTQVERRIGDIALYVRSQQDHPQFEQKAEEIAQLLRDDLRERETDCHVGGIKLLNVQGQIQNLFGGGSASIEYGLATTALRMLQAGIRTTGKRSTAGGGIEENVHNVYYLLNKIAGQTVLHDGYWAENSEDIDRGCVIGEILTKTQDPTSILAQHFDQFPDSKFSVLNAYLSSSKPPISEEVRDAILVALLKSTPEIPEWMKVGTSLIADDNTKKMLFLAAKSGNGIAFAALFQQVSSTDNWDHKTVDAYGYTLTECVVLGGNPRMLDLLGHPIAIPERLGLGMRYMPDSSGHPTLLGLAAESGSAEMIRKLKEMIDTVTLKRLLITPDGEFYMPYHRAVMSGNLEAVQALEVVHADVGEPVNLFNIKTWQTVYVLAANYLGTEGFRYLLADERYNSEMAHRSSKKVMPLLHQLMMLNQIDKLQAFLEKNPDLLLRDSSGQLALLYGRENTAMTVELIAHAVAQAGLSYLELPVAGENSPMVGHYLAQYQGAALKFLLEGSLKEQALTVLGIRDRTGFTVLDYLVQSYPTLFIDLLTGALKDQALDILKIVSKNGEGFIFCLTQVYTEVLKNWLEGPLKDRAKEILGLKDKDGYVEAQWLLNVNPDVCSELLGGPLKDHALDIFRLTDVDGRTFANYFARMCSDEFFSLIQGPLKDQASEIVSIATNVRVPC